MMETTLKYLLYAVAVVALVTGLNVFIGGAAAVPGASEAVEATVDNELRFFSVYWVAFGVFCFWVARNIQTQRSFIPFIALFFFISGLGRLLSTLMIGMPAPVLASAMILEFILPVVLMVLYRKLENGKSGAYEARNSSESAGA